MLEGDRPQLHLPPRLRRSADNGTNQCRCTSPAQLFHDSIAQAYSKADRHVREYGDYSFLIRPVSP